MKILKLASDYSRYPAGRYRTDGPYSGQGFREDVLIPWLEREDRFSIDFDGARGYGSSFLEEAFGGLVRDGYDPDSLLSRLELRSKDKSLVLEVRDYIREGGTHG